MSRKLFGDGNGISGDSKEESSNIEYQPPEEKVVDSELIHKLLEHYITERDLGKMDIWSHREEFKSEVESLGQMIVATGDRPEPYLLIDALKRSLRDESDGKYFTRACYLTAVIQALFNLGYTNEFVIDLRDWPESWHTVGMYLQGAPDKQLLLNLHGNFGSCGIFVEYCDFIIHDQVRWCGNYAKNCNFTFYTKVDSCGLEAEDSTFSLMPNTKFKLYEALRRRGNKLRQMNDQGRWETIR